MADLSRKTASIYINHEPAQQALESLQKSADVLEKKIAAGAAAGKNMVKEIAQLGKVKDQIAGVQSQIDKGLRPSFAQVQTQVTKLRNELKKMSEDAPGYAEKFKAYQKASLELQRLGQSIGTVKAEISRLGQTLDQLGGLFAIGGIAGAAQQIGKFFSALIDEALQAEEASARLQGTLDNLGKSDAFDRITAQSDKLAQSLGYLDNDDINGVFEQLITYGKLTEEQMSQLAPIIIDFAAKSRTSLPEASSTIIKALEGNGKALKEYGINIKDAATEEERFALITTDLADKVKGSAETFANTEAGSAAIAKQQVADLQEQIGTFLLPVYQKFLEGTVALIDGIKVFIKDLYNDITTLGGLLSNTTQELEEQQAKSRKSYTDAFTQSISKKSIPELEKQVRGQLALLKQSEKDLSDFNNSILKDDINTRNALMQQAKQDQELFDAALQLLQTKRRDEAEQAARKQDENRKADEAKAEENREKAEAKAKADAERAAKELAELRKKINDENLKLSLSNYSYQILKIKEEFDEQKKKLDELGKARKDYHELLFKLEDTKNRKLKELNDKSFNQIGDKIELPKPEAAIGLQIPTQAKDSLQQIRDYTAKLIADEEKKLQEATGLNRLKIQIKILQLERDQELLNVKLTEEEKEKIRKKFDKERADRTLAFYIEEAQKVLNVSQQLFDGYKSFVDNQNAKDQAKIDERNQQAEAEKIRAKKLLDGKLIDQDEYNRRVQQADEKARRDTAKLKKDQFERNKRAEVIQAEISGAQAILSALQTKPFFLGLILAGVAAFKTQQQISDIKSKKAPEFGSGGVFDGPRHSDGGMPVINSKTGQKVAELEGGEPILSRNTYRNNRSIVDMLLYSSLYKNGAPIMPAWQNRPFSTINFPAINKSISSRNRYERGGVFSADTGGGAGIPTAPLIDVVTNLNNTLVKGIKAIVTVGDINSANERLSELDDDTVMRRS